MHLNLNLLYNDKLFLIITVVAPVVFVNSTTSTTIKLCWISPGPEVDSYTVTWERDTSVKCSNGDNGSNSITADSTCYIVMGLDEDSSYIFTVTASNIDGSARSDLVIEMTDEAGERLSKLDHSKIESTVR